MRRPFPSCPAGVFTARKPEGSYHHGNLKETLLDAAEALIAQRGPAGISLSEMARMAGVSTAAIYRHYADLGALIGAVARRGFEEFALRLRTAGAASGHGPAGFRGMGAAYLAFARARPGAYAAMFSSPITQTDPELIRAGETAFRTLVDGLAGALAGAGVAEGDALPLAIQIWSLAHGVATLEQSGRLSPATGVVPEQVLDDGVNAILRAAIARARATPPAQ